LHPKLLFNAFRNKIEMLTFYELIWQSCFVKSRDTNSGKRLIGGWDPIHCDACWRHRQWCFLPKSKRYQRICRKTTATS